MTKLETTAYYDAIHAADRLVIIDDTDTYDQIIEKLKKPTDSQTIETIHIEVFQNDKNMMSYSLTKFSDNIFDLWLQKDNKVDKAGLDSVTGFIFENLPKELISPYRKYVASRINENRYLIKSFDDPEFEYELDSRDVSMEIMDDCILGQFVFNDGTLAYHTVNSIDELVFRDMFDKISDEKIRLFARTVFHVIPQYVFTIPAGISGHRNSASDLDRGGLLRHIKDAVTIYCELTSSDYAHIKFTSHERDMMLVATMFCDVFKHGWQEEYDKNHLPRYDHPKIAADVIRSMKGIISESEMNFIANCIESHSPKNEAMIPERTDIVLPVPDTEFKNIVQTAHAVASVKNISITRNDTVYVFTTDKIKTVKSYTIVNDHDIEVLENALDKPIDEELAKKLEIYHTPVEIIDVWKHIIESKTASDNQIKYIELAKKMIFE